MEMKESRGEQADRLAGKVALVTGASRGLGRIIALAYAAEGAHLALAARSEAELEQVRREVMACGVRCVAQVTDVTQPEQVRQMVRLAESELGPIDILVNNAGILGPLGLLPEIPLEEWEQTLAVNLTGPFLLAREVLPSMMERRQGNILNISSGAGFRQPFSPDLWVRSLPYNVSKGGLELLTQALAVQVYPYGICVNALAPGKLKTDIQNGSSPEWMASLQPAELVAEPAVFLARQTVQSLTGCTLSGPEWLSSNGKSGFLFANL